MPPTVSLKLVIASEASLFGATQNISTKIAQLERHCMNYTNPYAFCHSQYHLAETCARVRGEGWRRQFGGFFVPTPKKFSPKPNWVLPTAKVVCPQTQIPYLAMSQQPKWVFPITKVGFPHNQSKSSQYPTGYSPQPKWDIPILQTFVSQQPNSIDNDDVRKGYNMHYHTIIVCK